MTDHDPDRPRRPSPARGPHPAAPGPAPAAPGTALRDRWWWSPTLALVIGAVVVGYQLDALRGPDPVWLNWLVAGLGLAAAGYGIVTLLRAYRSR
ncbi:hypothetical protein [uncultured Cellulomonas sp.]|uniref:hypothetical protein n=1 Tax=uncultured Cellulomonas sp. TaxID=189682 RepID=UPI00262E34CD|nr:hypothetical protein [uncultured Cellulomonas sp.]